MAEDLKGPQDALEAGAVAVTPGLRTPELPAPPQNLAEPGAVQLAPITSPERDALEAETRTTDVVAMTSIAADGTPDQTEGFRVFTEADAGGVSETVEGSEAISATAEQRAGDVPTPASTAGDKAATKAAAEVKARN